jgi:N-acetylglutamate synthase-like GNAT family acetyltransferase
VVKQRALKFPKKQKQQKKDMEPLEAMGTVFARLVLRWQAAPLSIVPFSEACEHKDAIENVLGQSIRDYKPGCDERTAHMLEWYAAAQERKIANITEAIAAAGTGFWVAKSDNGEFVGCVGARCPQRGGQCHVFGLCVHPNERRKGVAQSLLAVVDMYAQAAGCNQVRASMPPMMQPAAKVFEYCGYSSEQGPCKGETIEVPNFGNFEFMVLTKVLAVAADNDDAHEMQPLRGESS